MKRQKGFVLKWRKNENLKQNRELRLKPLNKSVRKQKEKRKKKTKNELQLKLQQLQNGNKKRKKKKKKPEKHKNVKDCKNI